MIQVAHLSLPKVGETANGDRPIFREDDAGRVMLAVIDSLGHGPGAAAVSDLAARCLDAISLELSLLQIMEKLHAALGGSRGAAGTVCLIRKGVIEVCAVGNVEMRCDVRIPLIFSAGVLGSRVARFHICQAAMKARARLVLFSDGISPRTPLDDVRGLAPQAACDAIMRGHRRKEDDATVLVADVE